MNGDIIQALKQIEQERNIPLGVLQEAVESALTSSYRKNYETDDNVRVAIDWEGGGSIRVIATLTIVPRRKDPEREISLAQAKKLFKKDEILAVYPPAPELPQEDDDEAGAVDETAGEDEFTEVKEILVPIADATIESLEQGLRVDMVVDVNPKKFGRIAAQTTKQVIIQKIREAERDIIYGEYQKRAGQVISVTIQRQEHRSWICELGKAEGVIPPQEQAPGEYFRRGERVKTYVVAVDKTPRGPQVVLSRTHPELIKALFEMEVPEIGQGLIEIHSVAREPGSRSKVAVRALEPNVDPLGACVGPRGSRVQMVVDELRGEKIDIINYTDDPFTFVSNALSPARVLTVTLDPDDRSALVIVPNDQFSLAIGKEGQNARLAAKLTNWKIDIKSETQAVELEVQRKEEEERRRHEEIIRRHREEEEKRIQAQEEEKTRREREEKSSKEEEERRRREETERKKLEAEERRRREEEELRRLAEYTPQFDDTGIPDVDVLAPPRKDRSKQKEIENALKHIPKDVPVEQYVAMAYGGDRNIADQIYGPAYTEDRPKKKKKKKKKKGRQTYGYGYEYE